MRTSTLLTQALFSFEGEPSAPIALPHTWNASDGQDGGGDYRRGMGTYVITLPDPTPKKRQYIEFQGANHAASVYCNGRLIGTHRGGFSTFRFDLTDAMNETDNKLTVTVTNAPCDIYPQKADFTFFGGLYRDVTFIETEKTHFDLLMDGSQGVFVTPRVNGKTRIDLFAVNGENCMISASLTTQDGQEAAHKEVPCQPHTVLELDVDTPHLWNGVKDPYLYTAQIRLLSRDGALLDRLSIPFGYRSFHTEPDTGFWLNGKSTPLRGVSRHQDRKDKGWAISRADHEEDMALIQEIGANTIRLAHYQHDQYFYNLCDRAGMAVWAEIPFISAHINTAEGYENTLSQMRELIAQNYNHPSILFWGIANEITIGGDSESLYRNLCDVNALAKKLDPSRLTTMAQVSMVPMDSQHNYITDILSYNHYFGWYVGEVSDNGPWLDRFHALNPDRCLGVSEYGAENIPKWHTAFPDNHDYTEEYACHYHHEMLKTFEARPYLWSTHVWNMFDFAADARNEGGIEGRNNKGLVTYDRALKKDAFFLYKAYWNQEPMVYVCGQRFTDRAPEERSITVYTNQPQVTLFVNGEEIASLAVKDHEALFQNVPLTDGPNTVTARAGEVQGNTITLNAVAEHNYAYDLPDGNQGANWFDDPAAIEARKAMRYPEGFYSIRDKVGVLLADPRTAEIVNPFFQSLMNGSLMSSMLPAKKSVNSSPMGEFMHMMRLCDLLRMAQNAVKAEDRLALNEDLIQIPKTAE